MLNWIIDFSLRHRLAVILAAVACAAAGAVSVAHLDIDAFPDTTPVQVQVNTVVPSLGPEEVEQKVTFPVEQVLTGLPRLKNVRSISKFGLSQVVLLFEDGTDIYFARQVVNERLGTVELPHGVDRPKMGPVATGLGEVFHYVVTGRGDGVTELRTIHDWVIKPKLRTVPGAAEVNSWGGYAKQYQVRVDPSRLIRHGLTFDELAKAIDDNNRNVGGGTTIRDGELLLVHGMGRPSNAAQVGNMVITAKGGVPVRVRDVAEVQVGHEVRRAAVTADGKGEVVLGLGFMLMGENSHTVTWGLKNKLDEIKPNLPPNARVETVYDRTELVDFVIDTVKNNLFEAGLFVVAVLFAFLGNLRSAAIVTLAIPLSMLFAFSGMLRFGVAASLLSLGAIDFGMVVDSSVIMVENCVRHIARGDGKRKRRLEVIRDAAIEVRKPTMFGELIILIVYLPVLTLEGVEGKLFRPMALTVIFALLGSLVLSLTLMPVLASLLLPKQIEEREPLLVRAAQLAYAPVLRLAVRFRAAVVGLAACPMLVAFGMIAPNLGAEFIPQLSEGAIVINTIRLAGTDLGESIRANTQMEKAILTAFPAEVAHVWSRIGTPEVATDPMGVELCDVFITLKPRTDWKRAKTQAELTDLIRREVADLPGQKVNFTQPIEMRIEEMISGVRSHVGVKLFGDDFDTLVAKAKEVQRVLSAVPGAADVNVEQITGQPVLQVRIDQEATGRYGVPAKTVLDLVESVGSKPLGEVFEGQYRFPLTARLAEHLRTDPRAIASLLVPTPSGERLPLSRLAEVRVVQGPSTITREWGQRRITVTCNVKDRDLGGFVDEARRRLREEVAMPGERYHVEWGGQFENLIRAGNRLLLVVPLALLLIFGLLYVTYHSAADALRVFSGVPFAWVGGVAALWVRDMPFSISAGIGFVALSGVAVLNALVLVSTIRQLRGEGLPAERAVGEAARTRLRPVLMTGLVASLGFVPMALSTGMGAEVQRPLASVVIGGVISSTLLTLVVLPALYLLFHSPIDSKHEESAAAELPRPVREAQPVSP